MLLIRSFLLAGLVPAALSAQTGVTIPRLPLPGSAVRITVTQEIHFDVSSPALPVPVPVEGSTIARFVQRTGQVDSLGGITSELQYDTLAASTSINGTRMAHPVDLSGQRIRARFDSAGQVVELSAPPELEEQVANLRQLMTSSLGGLPRGTLVPGDSVVTPLRMPIPLDIGMGGAEPPILEGTVTYRLRSVNRNSGQVIALFDQISVGNLNGDITMPAIGGSARVALSMNGSGTLEIDVGNGLVRSGSTNARMEVTMDLGAGGTVTMTGSLRTSSQGVPLP